jgi:hypothetical protein
MKTWFEIGPAFSPEVANAGTANPRTAIIENIQFAVSDFITFPFDLANTDADITTEQSPRDPHCDLNKQ